jgi:hypothetical protein
MNTIDPEIVIRLPLSAWTLVFEHLSRGTFADVSMVIYEISRQSAPQTEAVARTMLEQAAALTPEPPPTTDAEPIPPAAALN